MKEGIYQVPSGKDLYGLGFAKETRVSMKRADPVLGRRHGQRARIANAAGANIERTIGGSLDRNAALVTVLVRSFHQVVKNAFVRFKKSDELFAIRRASFDLTLAIFAQSKHDFFV